jgi:hypothetical protein
VAGCCECGDKLSVSFAMELVSLGNNNILLITQAYQNVATCRK